TRALHQHATGLWDRVVGRRSEEQLAGGVAAGIGERIHFAAADFGGEREHTAQDVAERRAIVAGYPAAERQQLEVEDRFRVQQAEGVARRYLGAIVVAAHDDAGALARSERTEQA